MKHSVRLILLGAPGAGKGTQAEKISAAANIPAISTGAIIREAIATGTEMGTLAKSYIERGALVPDEVVIGIIRDRLQADDCKDGFILDGFPRTVPQAEALDQMGVEITDVLSIEVSDERIVSRMGGRRVCKECGATYHVESNPSPAGDKCGICGEDLTIRKDDDPAVVQSRLTVYHEQTEPLKDFYAKKGLLKIVEGQEKLEDTTALTFAALGLN
ncbi:MAG: adenylate kinase [Kiritimatiellae bacterium]|nr:adenylate kinase [Kiritimatiellia bacterium]